jgi:CheY-like chemotaxis protein
MKEAWDESRIANELHFVEDGEELMDYLYRRGKFAHLAGEQMPGMILLDLNMPKMDGREALQQIKGNPQFAAIPTVVLTTSKAEEDIVRAYSLGVNSFIVKPVTFQSLVELTLAFSRYWFEIVELPPRENAA